MIRVKKVTTIEELEDIEYSFPRGAKSPGAGKYWTPIPHFDLVNRIVDDCHRRSWATKSYTIALSNDKADMAFSLDIALPELTVGGMLSLGLFNPNSQLRPMRAYIGVGGTLINRLPYYKKHTKAKNKKLEDIIKTMSLTIVRQFGEAAHNTKMALNRLKDKYIGTEDATRLFVLAAQENVVTWSRAGRADRAFKENEDYSAWGCLVAFREALKMIYPINQLDRAYRFRQIVEKTYSDKPTLLKIIGE